MGEVLLGLLYLYAVLDVVAVAAALLVLWGDTEDERRRKLAARYTVLLLVTGPLTLLGMVIWLVVVVIMRAPSLWRVAAFSRPRSR